MKHLKIKNKYDIIHNVELYIFIGDDKMIDNYTEKWISVEDAADHLGVTKDTIRNWIRKTDIPAHKIGKLWKFKLSELDEWVKSGKSAMD
jgi:excisionase family DNA binding protein